jgi:hypothetical protein
MGFLFSPVQSAGHGCCRLAEIRHPCWPVVRHESGYCLAVKHDDVHVVLAALDELHQHERRPAGENQVSRGLTEVLLSFALIELTYPNIPPLSYCLIRRSEFLDRS